MFLQWTIGKRSFAAAVVLTLVFAFYLLSGSSYPRPGPTTGGNLGHHEPSQHETSQQEASHEDVHQPEPPQEKPQPSESPHQDHPTCSVTKVSMLYGAHKFSQLEAALESHRHHAERWGCGFEALDRDLTDRKLYSKHYFLLSTLLHELSKPEEERRQWLLWVDADSIIVNPALSPCVFLPPEHLNNVYALVTADHNGLNNGIFYLKVHSSSVDLLTQVAAYPLAHPEDDLGWFGEQAAMARVIKSIEAQHKDASNPSGIVWIPRPWINNYEWEHGFEGEPGSFLVHFAGLAETRLAHMASWLDELQNNQAKWEIPVERTFYKDAIPAFWNEYSANVTGKASVV